MASGGAGQAEGEIRGVSLSQINKPINPVLGPRGEVAYIIHRVEDVTDFVRLQEEWRERDRLTEELRVRTGRMESEVFLRARELDDANRRLRAAHEELSAIHESDRRRADESLRVSRERLELVLGSVELGLFYCDLPFDGLVWNDRCKEHFGLPPDAEVDIDLFYDRIHPDDRERTREAIERSIRERVGCDTDYRTVMPDGRVRWIRAIGRGFYAGGGTPIRFDGVTVDVTERRRAEGELRRAKEAAEASTRAKDHFLAVLSHELRTPLTPVLVTASALESSPDLSPPLRDDIAMIRRNVELEARMIDDLLDLTRIGSDEIRLRCEVVDVHAALKDALDSCRAQVQAKRLEVTLDLGAERHHAWADRVRLRRVFACLLDNASRFTPEGGRIRLRTEGDGTGRLRVTVEDTGVGIEPEALGKVFDAFEQAGRTVTRGRGGLGVGLCIARTLVEKHGGTLTAASGGRGKGAAFTLGLSAVPVTPAAPAAPDAGPVRTLSILLVEDHEDTLRVIARLLKGLGHAVTTARGVGEALGLASLERFDLLVSDIGLPDGSGLDIMREIRDRHGVRGIALSGFGQDADIARSRDAGFEDHLVKPVDFDVLRTRIEAFAP